MDLVEVLEDFGIIPVEAQAFGTPVIALKKERRLERVSGSKNLKPS